MGMASKRRPNLLFVFADQMRARSAGYAGCRDVETPWFDRLAGEGTVFTNAVSSMPVCTPYRASLLTGRWPLSTGLFINDLRLSPDEITIADVLKQAGYQTGYIGKWHLDGPDRLGPTPPGPRRQGFDFWAVANCTHDYMRSIYYRDDPTPRYWEGYDARAQTDLAIEFMRQARRDQPFCLFMSWGPPHNPYRMVSQELLDRYDKKPLAVPRNCPNPNLKELAGYYAHITALDREMGRLLTTLDHLGVCDETLVVFTSDHGDMLGSHGVQRKQWPWDESVLVPFLMRGPGLPSAGYVSDTIIGVVDVMPTLLGLLGVGIPGTVEGVDLSKHVRGGGPESILMEAVCPFGECPQMPEWRGVRTKRHTYARRLDGPWLLYDNKSDPEQMTNLVDDPARAALRGQLDKELQRWLEKTTDPFKPREYYVEKYGYHVDKRWQIPYTHKIPDGK
ncbi:MAG: sulfatase [Phycisphaerae bacterium]|nr:sulfatase [Phycisphaerae bacterium]